MNIVGIHFNTHESGVAVLRDGTLVSALSQERLDRQKMSDATPAEALWTALDDAGLSPADVDHLAVSDDIGVEGYYDSRVAFKKAQFRETWARAIPYFGWKFWRLGEYYRRMLATNRRSSAKRQHRWDALLADLRKQGFGGNIHSYEHGYNHACTAYYCSGFQEETLVFVMEAAGFINASSVYLGKNGRLEKILDIPWPHSPGRFYETITLLLGFRPARHEGKITGLAALGDPAVLGDYARELFHLEDRDDVYLSPLIHLWRWDYRRRKEGRPLPRPLRNYSREDIAAAWQTALEETIVGLVRRFLERYPHIRHVALAGGVHGNVKLNQRINELEQVEELYVHPGMSDCGQPVGAALACWAEVEKHPKPFRHETVYLGPAPDAKEIEQLTRDYQLVFEDTKNDDELADAVAGLLADNKIVAICRGRMEYGPRALGARTIMYAATDPSVNDWLNKQLKRTEFMPFAPVTLIEDAERCYLLGNKSAYSAGFMTVCYDCTEEMKQKSPAVVHVDGTARPQYISRRQNPFYYDVLNQYKRRTEISSVVNTSFNMHEEPIVCSVMDALKAFVASNLDALVLEDRLLRKDRNPVLRENLTGMHEVLQTPADGEEPQD